MSRRADVLVRASDGRRIALIAEVKRDVVEATPQAVAELTRAMLANGCHNGMLVTRRFTYVYRDTFGTNDETAIEMVGENPLSTATVFGPYMRGHPLQDESRLLRAVAAWLQQLVTNWCDAIPADGDVAYAFLPEVVRDVAEGSVLMDEELEW